MSASAVRTALSLVGASLLVYAATAADWPELRGPHRDGVSTETGLPETWSPAGTGLIWRAPYGGMSAPVVLGDRVCVQNTVGAGGTRQERVMCLDANTGLLAWEKRLNITHSDVPEDRVGSATPAVDRDTGHVYIVTGGGVLAAFTRTGVPLWTRDLVEEFGLVITATGHLSSPIVEARDVIVSGVTVSGDREPFGHRFLAFDKKTGEVAWMSTPGGKPFEPSASPPLVTEVDGVRLLIAGSSDGAWLGLNAATGEQVWRYAMSTQAITSGAIRVGRRLIVSHGGERGTAAAAGLLAALDVSSKGDITDRQAQWVQRGFAGGPSSPIADDSHIYWIGRTGDLAAFDPATGRQLWSAALKLGSSAPILGDGKIYVGTEDGRMFVLRPHARGVDVVSQNSLGSADDPERIVAAPAASDGRIYVVSSKAIYAIGDKTTRAPAWTPPAPAAGEGIAAPVPASLQVVPAEAAAYPGGAIGLHVRIFDAKGRFIRQEGPEPLPQDSSTTPSQAARQKQAQPSTKSDLAWSVEGLSGSVNAAGTYIVPPNTPPSSAALTARLGSATGETRLRVVPRRWTMTFDEVEVGSVPNWWIAPRGTFAVRAIERDAARGTSDANHVLAKSDGAAFAARAFAGLRTSTNYTIESDVRFAHGTTGSGGVLGQGYELTLSGPDQQVRLQSWRANAARTKSAATSVVADTWYRLKLRVEPLVDGSVRARGKVWRSGEAEPAAWAVDQMDPPGFGQLIGSPGVSGDRPGEVWFDNVAVTPN